MDMGTFRDQQNVFFETQYSKKVLRVGPIPSAGLERTVHSAVGNVAEADFPTGVGSLPSKF